jgi:8-amino-3,8-dideoxy-alpha-D-manno-octulosonate transaminase
MARKLNYAFRSIIPAPLQDVEIETTTICNRKCNYCPNYTVGRPSERMDEKTFYRIIDSLKKYGFKGRVSPHFYGEPLTDNRLASFIHYVHTNLPSAFIKLYTNGELLTVERYLELKRAGVNMFRISQHTEHPSKTVSDTISYVRENHPELFSVSYADRFNNHFSKLNRGGLVDVITETKHTCCYVYQMTFDYLGNAVLCCNDYNSSVVFGNIKDKDTHEIWHDKTYVKIRNMIGNGFWPYDICKVCAGQKGAAA